MNIYLVLQNLTRAIILVIAVLTLIDYLRAGGRIRMDVALMFADLGFIVVLQLLPKSVKAEIPLNSDLESLLLMAFPFLFLRLIQHLKPISRIIYWAALIGLFISWGWLLFAPDQLPADAIVFVVAYFVVVEVYATGVLFSGARSSVGVSHKRLVLAAWGSLLIAFVILISGITALVPELSQLFRLVNQVIALGSLICYYLGFLPPNWLRRIWRLDELQQYLSLPFSNLEQAQPRDKLTELCMAAERATGGVLALVVRVDAEKQKLSILASSRENFNPIVDTLASTAFRFILVSKQNQLITLNQDNRRKLSQSVPGLSASSVFSTQVSTEQRIWGKLLVFMLGTPLFPADELALLDVLARQAAVSVGYVELLSNKESLIQQMSRFNQRLKILNEIDRSILAAYTVKEVADTAMKEMLQLIHCDRASLLLIDEEKGMGRFISNQAKRLGETSVETLELPLSELPVPDQNLSSTGVISVEDIAQFTSTLAYFREMVKDGARSLIVSPLRSNLKTIGLLCLASSQVSAFSDGDLEIVSEISNQLAITIQQGQMREQLQVHARDLERSVTERTAQLEAANELLGRARDDLETRVIERTRELVEANFKLEGLNRDLLQEIDERKRLSSELIEIRQRLLDKTEIERLKLAQDLHDGTMQDLYGLIYQLEVIPDDNGEIKSVQEGLQSVIDSLRSLAGELRPPALAPYGLEKAIRGHLKQFKSAQPELEINLDLWNDGLTLPENVRLALYRIYQVAVTNVIRHSGASRVDIRFQQLDGAVHLEIEDNGRGFELPNRWIDQVRQGHLGLAGALERAEAVGGKMQVESHLGKGTLVRVMVPVKSEQSATAALDPVL